MASKFTLRMLAVAVAAIAAGMGALANPTPRVAAVVVNGVLGAVPVAACLAVGTRQPARSLWLGFALACTWALAVDELSRRAVITPAFFTWPLASMAEEALPPIRPLRGEPGTTLYFRSAARFREGGRFPVQYYVMGADGETREFGLLSAEEIERGGLSDEIGLLRDLPRADDRPEAGARATICRYGLACLVGLVGGLLSYAVRRRGDRRAASGTLA